MRLYSYVVARDYGFAPNPFHGFCTLATCKPEIRASANIDDWIVGTGPKPKGLENRLVYTMQVTEICTFDEYWNDPRFLVKRPDFSGSLKNGYGDNIYHRDETSGAWMQEKSHHSLENGEPNQGNLERDTAKTDRVLISTKYSYWGRNGPTLPDEFEKDVKLRKIGRGHKCRFSEEFVHLFVKWYNSLKTNGVSGLPIEWKLSA